MIAIIVAIREELRPLLRRLSQNHSVKHEGRSFHLGKFAERDTILCASGIGIKSARDTADVLLSNYSPETLVCAGVAGALSSATKFCAIVIGTEVFQAHLTTGIHPTRVFVKPRFKLGDSLGSRTEKKLNIHHGGIVTADRVATTVEEKRSLFDKTGGLAVDMETAAVTQVATDRHVKFLAVRAISDDADEALPNEINFLHRDGRLQWGRVAKAVITRPSVAAKMARLGKRAAQASEELAAFLEETARNGELNEMAKIPQSARPTRH